MSTIPPDTYPGEAATPAQVLSLAHEYRAAAELVRQNGRPGKPHTYAPFRSVAIHAIELYLNALLLHRGLEPDRVRGLQHRMQDRADLAIEHGLGLRKRTSRNLGEIGAEREYLTSRYAPERNPRIPVNRLEATLNDVAKKVTGQVTCSKR